MAVQIINIATEVLVMLIFVRCILSFIRHDPYQPVIRFIYEITEPIMAPFRKIIPMAGPIDISPIVALFAVQILGRILATIVGSL